MNKTGFMIIAVTVFNWMFTNAQKPVEIMQPSIPFSDSVVSKMLNGSTAQIKGIAYYEGMTLIGIKSEAIVYAPGGTIVSLYPLTPYLEEYLKLKKKNKGGIRIAAISPLAVSNI